MVIRGQVMVAKAYLMRTLASKESFVAVLAESEADGVVSIVAWWRNTDCYLLVSSKTSDGAAKVDSVVSSHGVGCCFSVLCVKEKRSWCLL